MNKIFRYIMLMVLGAVTVMSCTKEPAASISVITDEIEADYLGATATIGVKCNRDWTATCEESWITMTHSSEKAFEAYSYILITVDPIGDDPARTATVTIKSDDGSLVQNVLIKQGADPDVIRTAAKFVDYLKLVAESKASNNFRLGADIDLAGVTLPEVSTMPFVFDGQGYKISSWTSSKSMFGAIESTGAVKNIVFENATLTIPADAVNFGFVANTSAGEISGIKVSGTATVAAPVNKGYKGVVVGEATANITDCEINVAVSYNGGSPVNGSMYFGAVAGRTNNSACTISSCKNLGNITFTYNSEITQSSYVAGVVGAVNNNGKAKELVNDGALTITCPGSQTNNFACGIVCYAGGEVSGCTNNGAVSLYAETAADKADGPVKGLAVSGVAGYMGWVDGTMSSCTNNGAVSFRAGYSLGFQQVGSQTKFSTNVAGVVAAAYKCALYDCHNTGAVTSRMKNIDNAAYNYNTTVRQSVGGVISSSWGKITSCTNKGKVTGEWTTTAHNATLAKNCVCQAGGVSGGDYHSDQISSSMTDCTNEGEFCINCDSSYSNNAFGGVVGWSTKEALTGSTITGCVNKGAITVEGFTKARVGGVTGASAKVVNCSNSGKIWYKSGLASSAIGGISGLANFLDHSGNVNTGDIQSDVKITGSTSSCIGIGGLVGGAGNTAMTFTNCKVNCKLTCEGCTSMSMLVGSIGHNKANAKTFVLGTADAPMKVKGSFNGTEISASNLDTYKVSGVYDTRYTSNITINAVYGE